MLNLGTSKIIFVSKVSGSQGEQKYVNETLLTPTLYKLMGMAGVREVLGCRDAFMVAVLTLYYNRK